MSQLQRSHGAALDQNKVFPNQLWSLYLWQTQQNSNPTWRQKRKQIWWTNQLGTMFNVNSDYWRLIPVHWLWCSISHLDDQVNLSGQLRRSRHLDDRDNLNSQFSFDNQVSLPVTTCDANVTLKSIQIDHRFIWKSIQLDSLLVTMHYQSVIKMHNLTKMKYYIYHYNGWREIWH